MTHISDLFFSYSFLKCFLNKIISRVKFYTRHKPLYCNGVASLFIIYGKKIWKQFNQSLQRRPAETHIRVSFPSQFSKRCCSAPNGVSHDLRYESRARTSM